MEWYTAFSVLMATFFVLVLLGVPVVFAFFGTNVLFLGYFMGAAGFELLIDSVYGSLSVFVLLPITMFILQGEILFRTGLVTKMIDALDSWLGAVPGRLSLLAVGAGTILASLSGASIGTTAMLTRTLAPAMQERGYSKNMSVGPLLGSGGLAVMMPHSALGVILAVIAGGVGGQAPDRHHHPGLSSRALLRRSTSSASAPSIRTRLRNTLRTRSRSASAWR